ncbi:MULTISPECIES: glycosyltransferase [unclassified Acidisoma]|jgi:glycosyltransferase involved in cell wall biosynthesis|uniref:glycosyltransferase n=1 Tax=unclassified Acidisoma TaxID=2634065 RepID=UPI00131E6326|nr:MULTISPECIES: glycosyltransferase [unclassified Acidisoma]
MTVASPRRILLTTDALGGAWNYSLGLARSLARRRVMVDLAVLGPAPSPAQSEAATQVTGLALHVTDLPLDWTAPNVATVARASAALAELAQAVNADTAQLHTPALVGHGEWPVPVVAVVHACVGTWWAALHGGPIPPDLAWRAGLVAAGLRRAGAIVAPSQAFADALHKVYGDSHMITVVHTGRMPAGQLVRDHHLPQPERHGVLAAGRLWDPAKNMALLEDVAGRLDFSLRAAGPLTGPGGEIVPLHHLRPLGVLDDRAMALAMDEARIFASPARYEPFGLSVLEAAQAGLPLVLSDIPTFRELWDGAAIFLLPTDTVAWTEALRDLHDDLKLCRQLGRKARTRANLYGAERQERAMWDLHSALLAESRRVPAA